MTQLKGNFLVMQNNEVKVDDSDYNTWFADHPEWPNPWPMHGPEVKYMACLWEYDGKLKACVTDRDSNNLELNGVSIEVAAAIMDSARLVQSVQ